MIKTVSTMYLKLFPAKDEVELINVTVNPLQEVDDEIEIIEASLVTLLESGSWGAWEPARKTVAEFERERVLNDPTKSFIPALVLDASIDNSVLQVMWATGAKVGVYNKTDRLFVIDDLVKVERDGTVFFISEES